MGTLREAPELEAVLRRTRKSRENLKTALCLPRQFSVGRGAGGYISKPPPPGRNVVTPPRVPLEGVLRGWGVGVRKLLPPPPPQQI